LYRAAVTSLDLLNIHFAIEDVEFDKSLSTSKQPKPRKSLRPVKDEPGQHPVVIPSAHTIQLIVNAFNSPLPKTDYISKFGAVCQVWTSPECNLGPALLYRLLYSFLRSGKLEGTDALVTAFPDDKIVQLASTLVVENWQTASDLLEAIPRDEIAVDFQFYNEIALKLWKRFSAGTITDPSILKGVLRVWCLSPSPCPMDTALAAITYSWHLESQSKFSESAKVSGDALAALETFRDSFAVRKSQKAVLSSKTLPNVPIDQTYLLFEKWIECLHVDLLTVWIQCQLKHGLELDVESAHANFLEGKIEKEKDRNMNPF
jgi:hypothetical protein